MEAKDLMIGDWVQNPLGAKGWVKEIRLIPKDSDGFGGYYLVDIAYSKDGDSYARLEAKELNPIPLAPEILEKNGFAYNDLPFAQYWEQFGLILLSCGKGYSINCGSNISMIINSVNQLQHALKLCGIKQVIIL